MMALKPRKIAIVGVGHVGSHCALSLATQGICDELIMIDIDQPKALAQARVLADATVYLPHHVDVRKGDLSDCKDADLVVISAGPLPKPGQTRVDTLFDTIAVMDQIIGPLIKSGFDGILI
jgi:L-lactate dehydrogenase